MDIKTLLILIGLGFLLWSCNGAVSQETPHASTPFGGTHGERSVPTSTPSGPASTRSGPRGSTQADPSACYATALAAVRDQWPSLSQLQRAALGAQAIEICEAQP